VRRALATTAVTTLMVATTLALPAARPAEASSTTTDGQFVVLYERGVSDADGRRAIRAAGGSVMSSNPAVGYAAVTSNHADFAQRAQESRFLVGAARNRSIGSADKQRPAKNDV
jgi:hypothetical protein